MWGVESWRQVEENKRYIWQFTVTLDKNNINWIEG